MNCYYIIIIIIFINIHIILQIPSPFGIHLITWVINFNELSRFCIASDKFLISYMYICRAAIPTTNILFTTSKVYTFSGCENFPTQGILDLWSQRSIDLSHEPLITTFVSFTFSRHFMASSLEPNYDSFPVLKSTLMI